MADVNTTIKSSGGTYLSLAAAEADDFGCSAGQSALCEYAEAMTDSTGVTINTTVPSAIEISVQSAYRHNGGVSSGAVLAPSSGTHALLINVPATLRYLRVDCTNITSSGANFYDINGNSYFNHLFVHDIQDGDYGIVVTYNAANIVVGYRSICSSQAASGTPMGFVCQNSGSLTCYFCTGYTQSSSYVAFRNTATFNVYSCIGFAKYPFYGSFSGDYNCDNTSNSTYQGPGANSNHDVTPGNELTDVDTDDFSVLPTSTNVKDEGYDYGSPYTDADIAGNSMNGTPDIGAFEYVAGTTPIEKAFSDSASQSDASVATLNLFPHLTDAVSFDDALAAREAFLAALTDSLSQSDSGKTILAKYLTVSDAASFSDSTTLNMGKLSHPGDNIASYYWKEIT